MRNKCEKVRNMSPKGSQEEGDYFCGGLRVPLPADHISWEKEGESFRVCDSSRWGEDPRALRPLRGDRRIPFGLRHVPLEAASVESSGVQWSTANYVELIVNFNKSRLCKKSSKK